jgi:hypothetical protein
MSKVRHQRWLPKSWVCGRITIPIYGHDLNGFAKLHTKGSQVRFPVNLAEEETVAETDIIIARLLAV